MTSVRPLSQPTLASAEFWRSGADGVLRISHCADCGRYFHPPLPLCPSCRSRTAALAPVSGKAVVVGFSVSHQSWLPKFPPPYVVAIVALAEDDRARLTTGIVGCAPDEVRVGMRVRSPSYAKSAARRGRWPHPTRTRTASHSPAQASHASADA